MKKKIPAIIYFVICFYIIIIILTIIDSCKKSDNNTFRCSYMADIQPLVNNHCALSGCHQPGSTIPNFTDYNALKKDADNGRIQSYIFDLKIMPPAIAPQLTESEKEKLKCWLDSGAAKN